MESVSRKKIAFDLLYPTVVLFCLFIFAYGLLNPTGRSYSGITDFVGLYYFFQVPVMVSLCFVFLPLVFGAIIQIIKGKKSFPLAIVGNVVGLILILPSFFLLTGGLLMFFVPSFSLYIVLSFLVYYVITRLSLSKITTRVLFGLSMLLLIGAAFILIMAINQISEERRDRLEINKELGIGYDLKGTDVSVLREFFDDKVLYCKEFSSSAALEYCAGSLARYLIMYSAEIFYDKPIDIIISPSSKEFLCQKGWRHSGNSHILDNFQMREICQR